MTDAGENIFFINNNYTIQKISRKLLQHIGLDNGSDLVGKTCYSSFFKRDDPCEHCPVGRSITFQTVVEEDIPIEDEKMIGAVRHAVATPVLDESNQVRQVIVDCLGETMKAVDQFLNRRDQEDGSSQPLPQMSVEESAEEQSDTLCAILFDKDFHIIVANQWSGATGFGDRANMVGQNLFSAVPFYNQTLVREKIQSFTQESEAEHTVFHTRADIYSDQWLEHQLYKLVGRSKLDACLVISKSGPKASFVEPRILMAEKAALLSRFASRISHDIKNPLALISTSVEFLKADMANVNTLDGVHKLVDYVDQIQEQVSRVLGILDTVNALKVHSMDVVSTTDVAELLDRAVTITLLSKPFPQNDIQINITGPMPPIHVAEINIERAFSELFKTLLKKSGENGQLDINLAYIGDLEEQFIFKIRSTIREKSALDLDEMMNEFFASGNRFDVSNLGLAIAYATIINHSGEMQVLPLDSGELEVLIKLPRVPKAG